MERLGLGVWLVCGLVAGCEGTEALELTPEAFEAELYALQCELETCEPHTGEAGSCGTYLQPRTDCLFDPGLAGACLDAVYAQLGVWCGGDPNALPKACDAVCPELLWP